jgi:hypothetical protein
VRAVETGVNFDRSPVPTVVAPATSRIEISAAIMQYSRAVAPRLSLMKNMRSLVMPSPIVGECVRVLNKVLTPRRSARRGQRLFLAAPRPM